MPSPSSPSEGKGPVGKAEKPDDSADASSAMELKQFIYHINPSTNQVVKIEELNEQTGEKKEIPMENYEYEDPYAGYNDPYASSYSDPYPSGYNDPYASSYDDPYSYAYSDGGDYSGMSEYSDPYAAESSGYGGYEAYGPSPCIPPPRCLPPRCIPPPRCLPPRCLPPRCPCVCPCGPGNCGPCGPCIQ